MVARGLKKSKEKGLVLVLSGGVVRGLAHIGVLEVLNENKIPIDLVVGTSAGALIGAAYCTDKLESVKNICLDLEHKFNFLKFFLLPFQNKTLFNSSKMDNLLRAFWLNTTIQKLKTPIIIVSCDVVKNKTKIFTRGNLFQAVRSSIAVPGVFSPLEDGNSILVDGGLVDNVPVDIAMKYANGKKILTIDVDCYLPPYKFSDKGLLNLVPRSLDVEMRSLSMLEERGSDLVIRPKIPINQFDLRKIKLAIQAGRKAAIKALPDIKKLLKN